MSAPPDVWNQAEFEEWMDVPVAATAKHHHAGKTRGQCFGCMYELVRDLQEARYGAWEQAMGEDL